MARFIEGRGGGCIGIETSATVNRRDVFSSVYRGFAEQLCAAGGASGGKRWRVATIGEVAGILNSGTGPVTLAENNRFREIPGAANGLRIPLPTAERGGGKNLTDNTFVVSAHEVNGGRPLPVLYELDDGKTKLGGKNAAEDPGPRYACVLEGESFSPTPPLLGVRLEGDGRVLAGGAVSGVRGPAVPPVTRTELSGIFSELGQVVTITASAWRNVLTDSSFRAGGGAGPAGRAVDGGVFGVGGVDGGVFLVRGQDGGGCAVDDNADVCGGKAGVHFVFCAGVWRDGFAGGDGAFAGAGGVGRGVGGGAAAGIARSGVPRRSGLCGGVVDIVVVGLALYFGAADGGFGRRVWD